MDSIDLLFQQRSHLGDHHPSEPSPLNLHEGSSLKDEPRNPSGTCLDLSIHLVDLASYIEDAKGEKRKKKGAHLNPGG